MCKLEDEIILCGKITDRYELACYYKRSALFLFPSYYDASSIVQIEAASQKTPTIFLENSATSANIIDNVNGELLKEEVYLDANKYKKIEEEIELVNKKIEENTNKWYFLTKDM